MAKDKEREMYLGIESFGYKELLANEAKEQNEEEKKAAQEIISEEDSGLAVIAYENAIRKEIVRPKSCKPQKEQNLNGEELRFPQDKDIKFYPWEHKYIYKDLEEFTPISSVYSSFFKKFDAMYWSEKKSVGGLAQHRLLEEWRAKGAEASECGTFLHEQIEMFLLGKKPKFDYNFVFAGNIIKQQKTLNIETEWGYFKRFMEENNITPFRTEWRIFDPEYKIAGTIDLICRDGDAFSLYDWKRSKKIVNDQGEIDQSCHSMGLYPIEHLADNTYIHYSLQQSLYRYILEKNYGIKIKDMFLLVLHPNYQRYYKVKVDYLKEEVCSILSEFKNRA